MDDQEKHGGFIQFPLQLLATDWTLEKVMAHALGWSAHLLVKKWEKEENSPFVTLFQTGDFQSNVLFNSQLSHNHYWLRLTLIIIRLL